MYTVYVTFVQPDGAIDTIAVSGFSPNDASDAVKGFAKRKSDDPFIIFDGGYPRAAFRPETEIVCVKYEREEEDEKKDT